MRGTTAVHSDGRLVRITSPSSLRLTAPLADRRAAPRSRFWSGDYVWGDVLQERLDKQKRPGRGGALSFKCCSRWRGDGGEVSGCRPVNVRYAQATCLGPVRAGTPYLRDAASLNFV